MNFDITRQSLFKTILFFLIFYAFFRGREYFYPEFNFPVPALPWIGEKLNAFFLRRETISEITLFLLTFLNGFYVTRIITRNLILLEKTYMPALVYLTVGMGLTVGTAAPVFSGMAFLLIFAIDSFIASHKKREQFHFFFHASLALGTLPLLYAPGAVYFLLLPVCLLLYRRQWRDIVVSLVGYTLPFFIVSYLLWGTGERFLIVWDDVAGHIAFSLPATRLTGFPVWDYTFYGLILFITILSLASFWRGYKNMRSRAANGYRTFLWAFVLTLLMIPFATEPGSLLAFSAVPLALVVPTYFNRNSGLMPNMVYIAFMGYFIVYNLYLFSL